MSMKCKFELNINECRSFKILLEQLIKDQNSIFNFHQKLVLIELDNKINFSQTKSKKTFKVDYFICYEFAKMIIERNIIYDVYYSLLINKIVNQIKSSIEIIKKYKHIFINNYIYDTNF